MNDRAAFETRIRQTWAAHFGVEPETVRTPGTTLLPEEKFAGQKLLALWRIGEHVFAQADPGYTQQVTQLLAALPPGACLSAAELRRAWGAAALHDQEDELVFYLFPPDLPEDRPGAPYTLRRLTAADAPAMDALHHACTPEEVDEGFVEVDHQIAFGAFEGDTLAAAASGYERTGFMDIGVLVHPAHRRRRLAHAVVGELARWANQNGYIAQYRCNARNFASRGVAESLHFRLFSQSEAVWLKADD